MSATVIAFPAATRPVPLCAPTIANGRSHPADSLVTKFTDHFLPVVQASVDLLEADERDFEDRCRRMLDTEGLAMIDELCAEMKSVGRQMRLLVDGLDLTRSRLRTARARLADERVGAS